ncbi:MAG TPA: hypothetical protein VEA99_05235 [Gemmatimonadaceae bacterium]|nr:hypothetical protein [Gemmatimonadaceae bacterium]
MRLTTTRAILALGVLALAACGGGAGDAGSTVGATTASAPIATGGDTAAGMAAGGSTAAAAPVGGALLDPDAATREQLAALPGMDPALADSLIAKRPHADMRAVDRVLATRLTEQQRDTIYARLFKPIDLNKASKEEIELIPGVGPRMRREFEEYRPYRNIQQFRREMGKYVDSTEVARLERYVTIK